MRGPYQPPLAIERRPSPPASLPLWEGLREGTVPPTPYPTGGPSPHATGSNPSFDRTSLMVRIPACTNCR